MIWPQEAALAGSFDSDEIVAALKAAAEPTRLRILLLLAAGELNVKDLTQVLGQSQPRISRHLKLLAEAGLIERFREGSWAYFHVSDRTHGGRLALDLLGLVDETDPVIERDRERSEALKREREAATQSYFRNHAADWDRIRALHVAESEVEEAMGQALGPGPFKLLVDLGTGTGRTLEFLADRFDRGLGFDLNQAMLAYARSKLARAHLTRAQVRHGDIYALSLPDGVADAVVMHQVLHFLAQPALAIREAARVLAPGGKLLIVDFAPHDLEFLREEHAHDRLGFAPGQVAQWMKDAGLNPVQQRDLAPEQQSGSEKLTVSLWLAEQQATAAAIPRKTSAHALQETP
jgi:ubiquinone/menaquinone biosynthesis C-methylase UbiE/DNA-binding transcriptional ArsR family regulator